MSKIIIGHKTQRARLKKLIKQNTLPNTILFTGFSGIGKRLVALDLSKTLLCENPIDACACNTCKACKVFEHGNCPDLHFIDCEDKENWNTAKIRELLYTLNLKSFSGANRVVLFNNAEHMAIQAVNALLKSLEEPRPGLYFILITANRSLLLATLVSRCHIWHFNRLTSDELTQIIEQKDLLDNATMNLDHEEIALLADGSMANVESINNDIALWKELKILLSKIAKGNLSVGLDFIQKISRDKEKVKNYLRLMSIFARLQMHQEPAQSLKAKWAVFLSDCLTAPRLIFNRNLSANYVLHQMLLRLARTDKMPYFTEDPQPLEEFVV